MSLKELSEHECKHIITELMDEAVINNAVRENAGARRRMENANPGAHKIRCFECETIERKLGV